jgi:hypothetical protein
MSSVSFDADMTEVDTFPAMFDVLAFATNAFINALVDDTDRRHELAHFINERAIFFDRYNQIALKLFDLLMVPVENSHVAVTEVCVLSKLFYMENYIILSPVVERKKNKQRTKERVESKTQLARNLYLLDITLKRILEHGLVGGGPADTGSHEGRRWKQIYGVPFDFFVDLSNEVEAWLIKKGKHTYLKYEAPFKLRVMACFRQLMLGGPFHQHREGYSLITTLFRGFFNFFLDWLWDIRTQHVKMPTTKEEINHVENLFCHVGYPGCLGFIDCVHVPWRKCTWMLQTQCKNKKRAVQQLFLRWWRPTLLRCCKFHACFGGVAPMHLSSSLMRLCTRSWMADTPLLHSKSQTLMGIK